jgi:hypothetical protein
MKVLTLIVFSLTHLFTFAQIDSAQRLKEAQAYQDEMNLAYADKISSPLGEDALANFKALPFYPISSDYIITARFEKFKKKQEEIFKTSTSRMPSYVIYGKLYFEINGTPLELTLYQNPKFKKMKDLKDHLFLPFTDISNGTTTYGGGRYLDITIPKKSETVILDFNKAYNPYCAYSDKHSCPVPPKNNFLDIEVQAGVMLLKQH